MEEGGVVVGVEDERRVIDKMNYFNYKRRWQ
jgi:hypothetical protein